MTTQKQNEHYINGEKIRRSHAINLNNIESITPLSSGDSEVKLDNGKVLSLSRRYKYAFKSQLM